MQKPQDEIPQKGSLYYSQLCNNKVAHIGLHRVKTALLVHKICISIGERLQAMAQGLSDEVQQLMVTALLVSKKKIFLLLHM